MAKPSLRTEVLLNLAVLAAAALVLAIATALLAPPLGGAASLAMVTLLIGADLAIIVAFGRYLLTRLVTRPIEVLVSATEAVANGQVQARAPGAVTRELDTLAASVNRMTERLLDAQGALVRAEKLATVGRLAAGIAHEVGNPLAAISSHAEVLRRRGADPELVAALEREAGRIDGIVRGLLAYARPGPTVRSPLDAGAVAAGALQLLRSQGVLKDLDAAVERWDPLPQVGGDAVALEQVFVNLLLNAADAAGPGGRVRLRAASDDGTVSITVCDDGPGVPEEDAGRVFEPFYTTKAAGRGTGLGLAIVQRIVGEHEGRVAVGRSPEGGAAFTVPLPVREP